MRGTVGATQRLPRILGKRLAKDMMFTGRMLTAEEAREAGLVSRLVSAADLQGTLEEITKTILNAPKDSLRLAKRCIDRGVELDPKGALETEIAAIEEQLRPATGWGRSELAAEDAGAIFLRKRFLARRRWSRLQAAFPTQNF